MRKGRLNQAELRKLARIWQQLDELQAQLPADYHQQDKDERAAMNSLVGARNHVGELLAWQDHGLYEATKKEVRS